MKELYSELTRQMQGDVHFDKVTRQLYSTDASMYQIEPIGVVIPRHEEDLHAAMEAARKYVVPVLPRGGGTSLAGQCVGEALMMDVSTHMNKVLELNLEEEWVRVQPGVVQDQLNKYLAAHGYGFGPDTSTSNRATIGGMTGNNSAGARSVIYGKTVDHVIEVDAILSDGSWCTFKPLEQAQFDAKLKDEGLEGHIYREVMRIANANKDEVAKRFPKIMRRVSGYNLDEILKVPNPNLAKLLVGSEGTLAVSRSMKVKIVPLPKHKGLLVAHFENMIMAVEADGPILEHGPSAAELVDKHIMDQALESPVFHGKTGFLQGRPGAIIIVEFYGESEAEINDKLDKLEASLKKKKLGYAHVRATTPAQMAEVWNLRKGGLGLLSGTRTEAKPVAFVEDTAVDPLRLPGFLKEFEQIIDKHDTQAGYYGHASVGCLHIRPFVDMKKKEEREKMMSIFKEVADLVEAYDGTISGEHGDGLARSWLIEKLFGAQLKGAFEDVKAAFDPNNLMNPGKIVDPAEPTDNLRLGEFYQDNLLPASMDFTRDGGFNFSIEMCNGNGQCRKLDIGTMCPSYQATLNDRHSTRGRSNALRGLIAGTLPMDSFLTKDMYEVMDLCVECKACKTECPSKVDMAKMKAEFLYQYNKKHGTKLRTRLFANAEGLGKFGNRTWPFSNLGGPVNKVLQKTLGIASQRKLPTYARKTFSSWFAGRKNKPEPGRPQVVLFNDTMMEYNEPQLGKATVKILEAAGYEVVLVKKKCCGRPAISKGMLDQARGQAEYNINLLKDYAAKGVPIVGVEPSCLLTLRDDYRDLVPGKDAEQVSAQTFTIDEFIAQLVKADQLKFSTKGDKEYLLHGHCHQKALVGTAPTLEVLRAIPGATASEINSGCCGMAGSFGYEAEHYETSMAIGETRLFPAVRKADQKTEIVADGFSCRSQIAHGTTRKARHLVEIIADALEG